MAKFQTIIVAAILCSVLLVDFAVQARRCHPRCQRGYRCVAANSRERRHRHNNVCVPARCFFIPRRGRCRNILPRYHFDQATMSCRRIRTGACYGRDNRFRNRENCELTCNPWHRR